MLAQRQEMVRAAANEIGGKYDANFGFAALAIQGRRLT
jgi:hypothetical protein